MHKYTRGDCSAVIVYMCTGLEIECIIENSLLTIYYSFYQYYYYYYMQTLLFLLLLLRLPLLLLLLLLLLYSYENIIV